MAPSPLLSVDEALARILASAREPLPAQDVALEDALGRRLAADLVARRTQPPCPVSAMDGYALRAADIAQASAQTPVRLKVIGASAAGHGFDGRVNAGEAVRIFTGAPVPEGADCILIQEDAQAGDGVVDAEGMGDVELPVTLGSDGHTGGIAAVVGVAQGDDVVVAGGDACHEDGEVVGLGAGIDEINAGERLREGGGEFFRVFDDERVDVAGGAVLDEFVLLGDGGVHLGVAMADAHGANAAEAIEVAASGFVPDILHFALNEHEGLFVEREDGLVEDLLAAGEEVGFVWAGVFGWLEVEGREGGLGAHGCFFW
jgi:hypothetical protein